MERRAQGSVDVAYLPDMMNRYSNEGDIMLSSTSAAYLGVCESEHVI